MSKTALLTQTQIDLFDQAFVAEVAPRQRPSITMDLWVREGSLVLDAATGEPMRQTAQGVAPSDIPERAWPRIADLIRLRDVSQELFYAELADAPEDYLEEQRATLNQAYDTFVATYGYLTSEMTTRGTISNPNLEFFDMDRFGAAFVRALEVIDREAPIDETTPNVDPTRHVVVRKAPIFQRRQLRPEAQAVTINSPDDALWVCLDRKRELDLPYIAELLQTDVEGALARLRGKIFAVPGSDHYELASLYLSGPVRDKLVEARAAASANPRYAENVAALEAVQPVDIPQALCSIKLGSSLLTNKDVEAFVNHLLRGISLARATYDHEHARWSLTSNAHGLHSKPEANLIWGTPRCSALEIISYLLNRARVRVTDKTFDQKTQKEVYVLNKIETVAARKKADAVAQEFQRWLWQDPQRAERLHRAYNQKLNNNVMPRFDGTYLTLPRTSSALPPRDYQKNAIARGLLGGNAFICHDPGLGKSMVRNAIVMESKRLNPSEKIIVACLDSTLQAQISEFRLQYPTARILSEIDFPDTREGRQEFIIRAATSDQDVIMLRHSTLSRISLAPDRLLAHATQALAEAEEQLGPLKKSREDADRLMARTLGRTVSGLKRDITALKAQSKKPPLITAEELGLTQLHVDEFHEYGRRIPIYSKDGVLGQEGSARGRNLLQLADYLHEINPGRGLYFYTATFPANDLIEYWTAARLLRPDLLRASGHYHPDAFANDFIVVEPKVEPGPAGQVVRYRATTSENARPLQLLLSQFVDSLTKDKVAQQIDLPEVIFDNITIEAGPLYEAYRADLAERIRECEKRNARKLPSGKNDNILVQYTDSRKCSLDMGLVNGGAGFDADDKVETAAREIAETFHAGRVNNLPSSQLVVVDFGVPKAANEYATYHRLKADIIKLGVPEEQIAFIQDATDARSAAKLEERFNAGDIRIIIGSAKRVGIGRNIQQSLYRVHYLTPSLNPGPYQQILGRQERFGNRHGSVRFTNYVTPTDAVVLQRAQTKFAQQRAMADFDRPVYVVEAPPSGLEKNVTEMKAAALGDPREIARMHLVSEIADIRNAIAAEATRASTVRRNTNEARQQIRRTETNLHRWASDSVDLPAIKGEAFAITIGDTHYEDRAEAGIALRRRLYTMTRSMVTQESTIGQFGRFPLVAQRHNSLGGVTVSLRGESDYSSDIEYEALLYDSNSGRLEKRVGLGLIQRVVAIVERIETLNQKMTSQLEQAKKDLAILEAEMDQTAILSTKLHEKERELDVLNVTLGYAFAEDDLLGMDEAMDQPEGAEELLSGELLDYQDDDDVVQAPTTPTRVP